ncbi:MAG: c-type cytochrome [Deltaproteobacteria bacterium]|nr:c-type cytochrome [Deltaproteobacteria bacterium]
MKTYLMVAGTILTVSFSLLVCKAAVAKDGKAVFTDSKCAMCHQVGTEVPTTKKSGKAIDVAGKQKDATKIESWLKGEPNEKGKKHPAKFKGSEEDMKAVAAWLATK